MCDTPFGGSCNQFFWHLRPFVMTWACHARQLLADKHMLSAQWRGKWYVPTGMYLHVILVGRVCSSLLLICRRCECDWNTCGGETEEPEGERCVFNWTARESVCVCELTVQCMGMSGTPPEVSHREGILLDVTMNRKAVPTPWTHPGLWCQGVTQSPGSSGGT